MADTRRSKVSFPQAVYLCLLGIFAPEKLTAEQAADNKARTNFSAKTEKEPNARIIRRAFWTSLALVLLSVAVGYSIGVGIHSTLGCLSSRLIGALQIIGALLLLWGTLFVRGWEIQTYCGVTFTERVNQWIYRALYYIGTAVIVCSLATIACA